MTTPINLLTCRADFEVAQRRPALMENWGYEYGHRLLAELERLTNENRGLTRKTTKLAKAAKGKR